MTNYETVFIGADNGGIEVYVGVGNKVGFAKTPKMLAYIYTEEEADYLSLRKIRKN